MKRALLYLAIFLLLAAIFFFSRPVFAVVLFAGLLLCRRLIVPMRWGRVASGILCALILSYCLSFIAYQNWRSVEWLWFFPLTLAAASAIGFLSFGCLFALIKDVLLLVLRKRKSRSWQRVSGVVVLLLTLLCVGYCIQTNFSPRVQEVEIELPAEARGLDGLRIVQISDLHITVDRPEGWLEDIVAQANALQPDVIVLTGDLLEMDLPDPEACLKALSGLKARYGVYSVLGNHDYFRASSDEVIAYFEESGLRPLVNENVTLQHRGTPYLLAGVTDPVSRNYPDAVRPSMADAMAQPVPTAYQILLSHQPVLAPEAAKAGFELMLSGHTHGGQFYPWTWVTEALLSYNKGLYELSGMKLYVNQGTGAWIPLRWGTFAEITLLKFNAQR